MQKREKKINKKYLRRRRLIDETKQKKNGNWRRFLFFTSLSKRKRFLSEYCIIIIQKLLY